MSKKAVFMKNITPAIFLWALTAFSLQAHADFNCFGNPPASDPPFFTAMIPDTITVACLKDVPAGEKLEAFDDTDPSFPQLISPQDNPSVEDIDPCVGGEIIRTWTATDMDNNTTVLTQVIIVLPDETPPMTTAPLINDTIPCELINYNTWVASAQLAFVTNTTDNCSAIGMGLTITDNRPGSFPPGCATLTVTFTAKDACNNQIQWPARLTARDNTPPVLIGIPPTDTIDCAAPLPPLPLVSASDNCAGAVDITITTVTFQGVDTSTCAFYQYNVVRTWRAVDACGNSTVATQIIRVLDQFPPSFTRPEDIQISCDADPDDLNITGNITNLSDNCSPNGFVSTFYQDIIFQSNCPGNYIIQRNWNARDVCNNTTTRQQLITVRDLIAPTFTVPANITLNCEDDTSPSGAAGMPTNLSDNCDPAPTVTFIDVVAPGDCLSGNAVRRVWTATDHCGNSSSLDQFITIIDETAPTVQNQAQDLTVTCSAADSYEALFQQWINARANASATDNCTFPEDMIWTAFNTGSSDPASLPGVVCPTADSVLLTRTVTFVVEDECGNRDSTMATFIVIDTEAPIFTLCPPDLTVPTDPGQCSASVTLNPPLIEDGCSFGSLAEMASDEQPITTNAAPGQEGVTPVNPVHLEIPIGLPLPINATGPATLTISLLSADAEAPTEFFNIFGEDGTLLGTTAPTPIQCSNSDSNFQLSVQQINAWAADGVVSIRLEPNIPIGMSGGFAVNAICMPEGSVRGTLAYSARDLTGLRYEYSIDDGPRIAVDPIGPVTVSLDLGSYIITYFATDCAGNVDSCSHAITVEDREAPVLNCPANITVAAPLDECSAVLQLPFPLAVSDNCGVGVPYFQTQPTNNSNAFITYEYDPNLNDYIAQEKTYIFTGVGANATADATLTVIARGDFNTNGAFVQVLGENNTLIGTTVVGFADCSDATLLTLSIPKDDFNAWAADGTITIRIVPNVPPVPPGVPGDGVNPCNPTEVTFDGDNDGVSYILAVLEYSALELRYFSQGATVLPVAVITPPTAPEHEFSVGITEVFYIVEDINGNADTCSFQIIVEDTQPPTALCQPTTVFINPSGVANEIVAPSLVDAGSFDNCSIAERLLAPATFNCLQAGTTFPVVLTVIDASGNEDTCSTLIRLEIQTPQPTANSGICGGDTLFLFANPPPAQGGVIYTFQWTGPQGFNSNLENPVIPNINPTRAGSYTVSITGITGCMASASVEVVIENLPLVPQLLTSQSICTVNNIVLNSASVIPGPNAVYNWYEGLPPNGVLLASTNAPQFVLPGPHAVGQRQFYLILESGPCITAPSVPVTVTISAIPVAVVSVDQITVCQGQPIQLTTMVSGPGLTYQWAGPNFMSNNQSPLVTNSAGPGSGGIYTLRVTQNGCTSAPDTVVVTVLPKPATPILGSSGPACEGASILLTASTPASLYHWIPPGGGPPIVTAASVLVLPNVNASVAGPWRVFVTQFGCDSDISAPLQVVVNSIPQVTAEAAPAAVCEGQSLQLFASPALLNAQYTWSGPAGYGSSLRTPVIGNMTPARAGLYSVTVTTAENCSASASITVSVLGRPVILGLSNNSQPCISAPTDVQLMATLSPPDNGTYTYEWSGPCPVMVAGPGALIPGATVACNGLYQLVVRNASGCASLPATTFVNLTAAPGTPGTPVITSGNAGAVCAGQMLTLTTTSYTGNQVIYLWQTPAGLVPTSTPSLVINSATTADSGPYSVFVQVDGCLSSTSGLINVVVNPVPVIVASSNSPVCEGQTIQFMSNFIPGASYSWVGLNNGFTSGVPNPVINNADSLSHTGMYIVTATRNGCMSEVDTVFMEVRTRPNRPVALPAGPVCISTPGASVIFSVSAASATSGATYDWFDQNNMLIGASAGLNFQFNSFASYGEGTFQFFVRARKNGCVSDLSTPLLVTFNTIPGQPPFAGDDREVCPNEEVFLAATAPPRGGGVWTLVQGGTGGESIVAPANPGSQINGLEMGGEYTFRWTLSNGACVNYGFDEVTLTVLEIEEAEAGMDTIICPDISFSLGATPVQLATGVWSQPDVQAQLGVVIEESGNPNSPISGLVGGNLYIFVWTVTGECGILADSVLVSVSDVSPSAGSDFRACNDEQFGFLEAQTPALGSFGFWSSPDTTLQFSNPQDPRATVFGLQQGFNTLIWTIDDALCGGASIDTVIVEYTPNPVAMDDTVTVVFGESTIFDVLANDFAPSRTTVRVASQPRFGTLTQTADSLLVYTPDLNFIGEDQFTYEICSEGCECSFATVIIDVTAGDRCDVPSVITPNGDKVNDFLVIPCLYDLNVFPRSQLLVFNRWGDEVFRSSIPYRNNWGGTYNGQDLPPGTYFYIMNFGDGTVPRRGFFMILR